jgi:hypothetical protein
MAETTPPHRPLPIIRGKEAEVALILKEVRVSLNHISDPVVRRAMDNIWSVAVAMANMQGHPNVWNARGEDLLGQLDEPHSGHLVAAMALYMSLFRVSSDSAIGILTHAQAYILRTAANTPH